MDKLDHYRQHIREIMAEYAHYHPINDELSVEQIIDHDNDHYELMRVGWENQHRIHGCLFHIDIKDGKIWIQNDGTEEGIANRLVAMGVPKNDIVLAFHSPFRRQFTEFAVN